MKNKFLFHGSLLLLAVVAVSQFTFSKSATGRSTTKVIIHRSGIPDSPAVKTRVLIHTLQGYGQDSTFAYAAGVLLGKIVNSDEFKKEVLNNTYTENQGLSPTDIYNLIILAHEKQGPGGEDHVIDLRLRTINLQQDGRKWMRNCRPGSHAGTVGIDGGGTGIAAVCPESLRYTASLNKSNWLAAHYIHEYMHILGFTHLHVMETSVPYKIQNIVEDFDVSKLTSK